MLQAPSPELIAGEYGCGFPGTPRLAAEHRATSRQSIRDGESLPLPSFRGEGTVATGWTGVLMGDDLLDVGGDQEKQSRLVARALCRFLDVPLGRPALSTAR